MNDNKGILLETGTNEFEIIEFSIGNVAYGINVAKVREVINIVETTTMPQAHPFVDGIFSLRGKIMPLVNLARALDVEEYSDQCRVIVSELNNYFVGFKVNDVSRIHRISWAQMEPPPQTGSSDTVIGIIKLDNKVILLLDFEKILAEINPEINRKLTEIPVSATDMVDARRRRKILVAEDSKMLRDLLNSTLQKAGYIEVLCKENGLEALKYLEGQYIGTNKDGGIPIDLVITDIEMPQMDGHHLLKRMRDNSNLQHIPVVIFSSLINEEMRRKGEVLGANAQITKPEIGQLIKIIDQLLTK